MTASQRTGSPFATTFCGIAALVAVLVGGSVSGAPADPSAYAVVFGVVTPLIVGTVSAVGLARSRSALPRRAGAWFAALAVVTLVAGLAGHAVALRATQGGLIDDPEWYPVWVAPVRLLVLPAAVGAAALGAIAARLLLGRGVSLGPAVVTAATGLFLAVSTVDGVVPWLAVAAMGIGWSLAVLRSVH